MRRQVFTLTLALMAVLAVAPASAFTGVSGVSSLDREVAADNVKVAITSPFSDLPQGGCIPYTVNIQNDFNAPGTWRLTFRAAAAVPGAWVYAQDLTVPPNASRAFHLAVPLPAVTPESSIQMTVAVTGPGFDGSNASRRSFAYIYTPNLNPGRAPYLAIGSDVLGPAGLGPLTTWAKAHTVQFHGTAVDAVKLPTDWRCYSGVANLALKDSEWLGVDPAQREAILDYVAMGGRLVIYTTGDLQAVIPQLQLPIPAGNVARYGFGEFFLKTTPAFPPDPGSLGDDINGNHNPSAHVADADFSSWPLRRMVGVIAVSGAFILLFVVLFGTLVGPVNLFYFAGGRHRMRLFWTTPAISLIASLALILGILLTDGIGGSGRQIIAIFSLPDRNREAVIQEQVARTAVLFSSTWRDDQNCLVSPITEIYLNYATDPSSVHETRGTDYSPDTYEQSGNEYSGSWFRSRSVTGQYLQAVRPSRSALTVMNPRAFAAGSPPEVLSSYPQPLDQVFLLDAQWHYWTCTDLEPGRKQTCATATRLEYDKFWKHATHDAGGKLTPLLGAARDRTGCFYATGTPLPADRLATLSEIRWQVVQGIYLGPWVASAAPEAAP